MKTVVILEQDEYKTLKTLAHDIKILLSRQLINFDIRQAESKIEDIMNILDEE